VPGRTRERRGSGCRPVGRHLSARGRVTVLESRQAVAVDPRSGAGAPRARVESVDLLRGLIMLVMALDHTRDFFGVPGVSPTDLTKASSALFLTRWITHFCAPVFFLLTGVGARLSLARGTKAEASQFLLTRGAWLITLEVTVLRCLAYQFNADYRVTMLVVLWALGWAMIALAGLLWLPTPAVLAFALVLIAGHDLLDGVRSMNPAWVILHSPGFVVNEPGLVVFVAYPLVPWIAVTAAGYALGAIYRWEAAHRRATLLRLGFCGVVAFLVVRGVNVYGDPNRWTHASRGIFTVCSFLNTTKYPPSLAFLLMTLGPSIALLGAIDGRGVLSMLRPVLLIGKVPLFYYAVHFFMIHALAAVVCFARTGSARWMLESPDLAHYPFSPPPGWGFSLPVVYLLWASIVAAAYIPCRWFAGVKARRTEAWLRYL
jgi:uncharacterized membrane protein